MSLSWRVSRVLTPPRRGNGWRATEGQEPPTTLLKVTGSQRQDQESSQGHWGPPDPSPSLGIPQVWGGHGDTVGNGTG